MLGVRVQPCPRCGGAINVEHSACEVLVAHEVTYLYCDFCGIGFETLWRKVGDELAEEFTCRYEERHKPVLFGKFLQRLENARVA